MRARTSSIVLRAAICAALLTASLVARPAAAGAPTDRAARAPQPDPAAEHRRLVLVHADSLRVHLDHARQLRRALRASSGAAATALQSALVELDGRVLRLQAELGETPATPPTPPTPLSPLSPASPEAPAVAPTPAPRPAPTEAPRRAPRAPRAPRSAPEPPSPGPQWESRDRDVRIVRVLSRGRTATDTTFAVAPGVTLELETFMGDIQVEGWARDAIHVLAEHGAQQRILATREGNVLKLESVSRLGPSNVDWKLRVPVWLPLQLSGITGDISVSGTRAPVRAQSVRGDVKVAGGGGELDLNSVEGQVVVTGAKAAVRAGSINNMLRLVRVSGAIEAQSVNGDIDLAELESRDVQASSLNGSVWWDGAVKERGEYRLASHNGTLYVGLPAEAGLDLTVSAYNGEFRTALPLPTPRSQRGRRFEFQLGGGGATVDLESFNGLIRLLRPVELARLRDVTESQPAPTAPRGKEKSR